MTPLKPVIDWTRDVPASEFPDLFPTIVSQGTAKPICLEVCSGEGGSTRGLMNAGWDVIAVDNSRARLKRNPARWRVLGDAFDAIAAMGADVDLIWAGWPCQDYSAGTRAARAHGIATGHKRLIAAGREAMAATGTPWVIENVEGARSELRDPIMLCGYMFDLEALDDDGTLLFMERHRLFESSEPLVAHPHEKHPRGVQVAGSYGGARRDKNEARHVRHGGYVPSAAVQAQLLEVNWMSQQGQYLAIPPAYSEFLGAQLLRLI